MTVTLPTYQGSTADWRLVDFLRLRLRTDPATGGLAQLVTRQLDTDELWLLDHMVVSCDSVTKTTLRLYESVPDPLYVLDGTPNGAFGVADWPAGLQIAPATSLLAVWVGASDGSIGVLTLQGRIMRKVV